MERVFRMYLRNQERAGGYFINGGISENEHGDQKENDGNETSDGMDDDHIPSPDDKEALEFAILSLPFYLSNADCNPKLVELSRSVLNQKMDAKLPELSEDIKLLHDAIGLYLKKEPVTPNEVQPNESQGVAERFRTDKRRRESNDDLEVTGAPALTLTSKRTKVMDALGPVEVLGLDPEEPMCL
ncbi:hypothetical protein GALMADRAFT_1253177 [Galerina marginata CBS 339.88]|uniref:Uncharacterized protein n=1 Tax=Galerina marginata (strain CBS 339.88) TaxID=685588 RepID=A0A067T826_GALM3|nr:hypothetical protein GALMADRAFT_1253177 [Galerina marginata CBS 339.88]